MLDEAEARFEAYVDGLASVLGHADRAAGLRDYCTGLMLPLERKSVEPLAAATAPSRVSAIGRTLPGADPRAIRCPSASGCRSIWMSISPLSAPVLPD